MRYIGVTADLLWFFLRCDVEIYPGGKPISRTELLNRIAGKDGLFCLLTDKIDEEVLARAGK